MQQGQRIYLRRWQREALSLFESSGAENFLAVATPGAGKTTFALAACVRALVARRARRVLVITPTAHLKQQWADAAQRSGLWLEPHWSSGDGELPGDLPGAVATYQQIAANPRALRPLARDAFVILDEIHHAAESRAWGDALRVALDSASHRLSLSGTPFRTDQNPIPFVRYRSEDAEPDYEYGYSEALADRRVVRPIYFPRIGGHMEWTGLDGIDHAHEFEDPIGRERASERLRTALSIEHEWLPAVLEQAHAQLLELRRGDPRAGAMVIAIDQTHARGIAKLLRERLRVGVALVTSDEPRASAKISEFARTDVPWIVAVRMVSEGVDIPRLRVGVFATNTLTELFFRQAVGRLVRWSAGVGRQPAYMFIPDDPRIRTFAQNIQKERRHSLRRSDSGDERPPRPELPEDGGSEEERDPEQLSLFAVISAVASKPIAPELAEDGHEVDAGVLSEEDEATAMELPLLAPLGSGPAERRVPIAARPSRRDLRALNAERAQHIARRASLTHATVNAELNRGVGIRRITEATAAQLEKRLELADAWLRKLAASANRARSS